MAAPKLISRRYEVLELLATGADEGLVVLGENLKRGAVRAIFLLDLHGVTEVAEHGVEDLAGVFEGGHGILDLRFMIPDS